MSPPRTRWLRFFLPSMPALRLSLYFTCVCLVISVIAARVVYAQVTEAAHALGRELSGLSDLTSEAEVVSLNGARLHQARITTAQPIATVLDRVEAHCHKTPGLFAQVLADTALQHSAIFEKQAPAGSLRRAIIRNESESHGVVICFADDRFVGLRGFVQSLQRFRETSDLSEFGQLRYVLAERQKNATTRVTTLWADKGLNLMKMFPGTGDAAGTDSRVLPRPPASRRTLCAAAEGMPYGLRLYESAEKVANLERFYAVWMQSKGWQLAGTAEREGTRAYLSPDGAQAFLSLFEEGGRSYVTLTEAGRSSGSPIASVEARK